MKLFQNDDLSDYFNVAKDRKIIKKYSDMGFLGRIFLLLLSAGEMLVKKIAARLHFFISIKKYIYLL